MEDIKKLVVDVLTRGELLSLGVCDDGGVWVCDLISVADDELNIYWISHDTSRHSQAIEKNPVVAATVSLHKEPAGVQIVGNAGKIPPQENIIQKIHRKQGREEMLLASGEQLYKLTPERFEVINLPLFGFQKKIYTLPKMD